VDCGKPDVASFFQQEIHRLKEVLRDRQSAAVPSNVSAVPSSAARPATREQIVRELLQTEASYAQSLGEVKRNIMLPLLEHIEKGELGLQDVTKEQVRTMFRNLTVLADFHALFLAELQAAAYLSSVFIKHRKTMTLLYNTYVSSYEKSARAISKLANGNAAFRAFITSKQECLRNLTLLAHLIMPVQRLPRYVLLLQKLSELTAEDHMEQEGFQEALAVVKSLAEDANEHKRAVENVTKLLEIQSAQGSSGLAIDIVDASRELLRQRILGFTSDVKGLSTPEQCTVYLFNDLLLWTHKSAIRGYVKLKELTFAHSFTFHGFLKGVLTLERIKKLPDEIQRCIAPCT
jgi:hypothetical protein